MKDADVDGALGRVDRLVARVRDGGLVFAADDETAELRGLVAEAEAPEGADRGRWAAARAELLAFFAQIHEDTTHVAVVRSADATSWVGWGGDTRTVVLAGTSPTAHVQALEQELRTRTGRLRMLTLVLGAAARISTLMTVPGAGVLALPVAWHLLRELRAEAERQGALAQPTGLDLRS